MQKYVFKEYKDFFPEIYEKERKRVLSGLSYDVHLEHVGSSCLVPKIGRHFS